MIKRKSIFIKILIPVIVVMLFQSLLISLVLFVNGTIGSLEDSAIESMRKNAENRSITLEDRMVYYWSNLDKLELDIIAEIGGYLNEKNLSISDALGNRRHETDILHRISGSLISTLRVNSSTGVYMFFVGGEGYGEAPGDYNGLYYRDLDPVLTPADYSDLLFLRGFVEIARKDNIQLDSLWNESFSLSPEYPDTWRGFAKPQLAAMEYQGASSVNLSYWNRPHLVNPDSPLDANKCITYTRPIFYNGKLVAIAGTEVRVDELESYFPSKDFSNSDKSGYILLAYDQKDAGKDTIDCDVFVVTGSYIKRLISPEDGITLTSTHRNGVYAIDSDDMEGVQVVLQPLRLYNSNAPFSGEQWALAAVGTDAGLFEASRNVGAGIIYSSVFALIAGSVLLGFLVRFSTRPLISIAHQIETGDPNDPISVPNANTDEIVLLCSTINEMKERRGVVEAQLREERERYLIALESTADTFIEYDSARDTYMMYYFSVENHQSRQMSKTIQGFMGQIASGEVCHPEDTQKLTMFFSSEITEPVEVRIKTSLFSHITEPASDGEYYWFLLKASRIQGLDGAVSKMIGTAREITKIKLEENTRAETARRDPTTGFYNRDYGIQLMKGLARSARKATGGFSLALILVDNFDEYEAHYGRVFGGAILRGVSRVLLSVMEEEDIPVRLDNDDFLIWFRHAGKEEIQEKARKVFAGLPELYAGENADLRLSVSIGAVFSVDGASFDELLENAYRAALHADGGVSYYNELQPVLQDAPVAYRDKPVSVLLDISKENIVGFVFELFERTTDIHSAVNLLLSILGEMFSLHRIIICAYDADFGANQVAYQWNANGADQYHGNIEKIAYQDLADFEALLDESGALLYDDSLLENRPEGIRQLLCCLPEAAVSGYCCVMYENGIHTGRILFQSEGRGRAWGDTELFNLYEITKIVAAHLSIEKSNSASRAKSEFLSRISHEIRTPMNAIIGMTDIAKNSSANPARLDDCLEKIDFSAKHLLSLINDVLEMSRIESGKLHIEPTPFSLSDFAVGIDTLMRPAIEGKNILLNIDVKCVHIGVLGDEYRLRQVLVNLLGNANKFTNPGGRIICSIEEIEQEPDDDGFGYFRFSVKDSGVGISQEDQPHIFRAFEQAESSSSDHRRQGTGLGLAISGNIISAMGSRIELNSRKDEGSEFFFTLRLKLEERQSHEPLPDQGKIDYTGRFSGKKALLVEDNEINIEIALYVLEEAGMVIDVARNGQEAVDRFFASDEGYYDIILMDIQMPVMDGLAATRNIRKNVERSDARTVPILAMTANAFDEDMKKSIESGMNGHIAKPIDNEKLYTLLWQIIGEEGKN